MNKDKSKSYAITFGVNGTLGQSAWDYDVGATRTEYTLNEYGFARLAGPINQWFVDNVLGPQQGLDPWFGAYPVFTPDYAAFYQLIPQSAFEGFTTYTNSRSRTYDNMLRAQLTNGSLFKLPGGDAGVAFAVEGGSQGWNYMDKIYKRQILSVSYRFFQHWTYLKNSNNPVFSILIPGYYY
jgi:hypothetical protein